MITFPTSPSVNQTYTSGNNTWTWDGYKWTPTSFAAGYVPLAGATMSGPLILNANPTNALGAATKQYVDTNYLPDTGGTLTGPLTIGTTVANSTTVSSQFSYANGSVGTAGQILASGGPSSNDYWTTPGYTGSRNKVINGDMRIDQRNNGANSTVIDTYTIDRWAYDATQASKLTWGRNLNAIAGPPGFPYYLGFQSSSAYSVVSSDYFFFFQPIEADFVSDFAWGTSNGKTVTLSFWAYSSLGGATPFSGCISNYAETRNYPFTFSIPTANTWTYITVIIPPDVAGTWVMSGNGGALYLFIDLGSGTAKRGTAGAWSNTLAYGVTNAVSIVGTSGATFYITGIQMEVGSIATPFERLPPYQSLANCQRYYSTGVCQVGGYITSSGWILHTVFTPVSMRANPTIGFIYTGLNNVTGTYSNVVLSNQSFYTLGFGTAVGIASYIANWTALAEL